MSATDPRGGARVRIPPPLVFLAFIAIGVALRYVVTPPPLPGSSTVQVVAGVVCIGWAVALGGWALGWFKRSGQDPAPWKESPSLVIEGPYRFTRNPMYVSMLVLQFGIGWVVGNVWIVYAALFALLVVHYTAVLPEEAYLEEKFGEPYREYKQKVRRYA
jgi:protein-S-isoprenylcysteine O-methyltransferase Ste14